MASNEQAYSSGTLAESSKIKNNNNNDSCKSKQKVTIAEDSISPSSATVTTEENIYNIITNSTNSLEDLEDPFLLVSLINTNQPIPVRPKYAYVLYLFGVLDLLMVVLYMIYSIHKYGNDPTKYQWGLVILCVIRFITVMFVTSSKWIKQLRWVLAGVCCLSSLYIIFKVNYITQFKKHLGTMQIVFLILSFVFSQIHWIVFVIVTTDSKRRAELLNYNNIHFEEDVDNDNNNDDDDDCNHNSNETDNLIQSQPFYGSIKNANVNLN